MQEGRGGLPGSGQAVVTSGLILVDKPLGPTSHDVVDEVRRLTGVRRVGHTGTLDPMATGLLLVCVGRATRLVRFLQDGTKIYEGTIVLGITTDTLDASGAETARKPCNVEADEVIRAMRSLTGTILQAPPMVSAVKIEGKKLYELARRGETVEREARPVRVDRFEMTSFTDGDYPEVEFEVACGGGTYVRSLAAELGERLACGAHLGRLRRTANGPYGVDEARTLDELQRTAEEGRLEEAIVPVSEIRLGLPQLQAGPDALRHVSYGRPLSSTDYPELASIECEGPVEVRKGSELVAVYRVECGRDSTMAKAEVVLRPAGE